MIEESAKLSQTNGLNGWRQSAYHIRQFKKKYRLVQKLKHSTSSAQKQKKKKADEIRQQHEIYLNDAYDYMNRAKQTRTLLKEAFLNPPIDNLNHYIRHASL
ncbi:Transposase, IS4 [Beggiatoa sp. PS]|nr:Transposase, IS4 [Beggiatoa sp. PS]